MSQPKYIFLIHTLFPNPLYPNILKIKKKNFLITKNKIFEKKCFSLLTHQVLKKTPLDYNKTPEKKQKTIMW